MCKYTYLRQMDLSVIIVLVSALSFSSGMILYVYDVHVYVGKILLSKQNERPSNAR